MSPAPAFKTSISTAAFPDGQPFGRLLADVAEAGFDAVELVIREPGQLSFDSPESDCKKIARRVEDAGLFISGLFIEEPSAVNLAAPDDDARQRAADHVLAALERATWLGTDAVILIPGAVGAGRSSPPLARYEEAYSRALDALLTLRFDAERRAVRLACRIGLNRFLLSPMESREFIDRCNIPWIGVCLDPAGLLDTGYPEDWIRSLGHRVARVYFNDINLDLSSPGVACTSADGQVLWPEVMSALREVGYQGPATYHGAVGNLAEIKARLDRIVCSGQV